MHKPWKKKQWERDNWKDRSNESRIKLISYVYADFWDGRGRVIRNVVLSRDRGKGRRPLKRLRSGHRSELTISSRGRSLRFPFVDAEKTSISIDFSAVSHRVRYTIAIFGANAISSRAGVLLKYISLGDQFSLSVPRVESRHGFEGWLWTHCNFETRGR